MDKDFDMYDCIPQEQFLMQRLLAYIRGRQNYCTDTECIDDTSPSSSTEDGNFTMMTMFMIFAVIMYLIRPESIMKFTNTKRRVQGPGQDRDDQPPPPPPPAPPAMH